MEPGLDTMVPKNKSYLDIIGNAETPSFLDFKIVNSMYQCACRCSYLLNVLFMCSVCITIITDMYSLY